jgi:hypothetical protein
LSASPEHIHGRTRNRVLRASCELSAASAVFGLPRPSPRSWLRWVCLVLAADPPFGPSCRHQWAGSGVIGQDVG